MVEISEVWQTWEVNRQHSQTAPVLRMQQLVCYLCGRENRLPATLSQNTIIRCGDCGALLIDLITCSSCGTKNRVKIHFAEHQRVLCGKCQNPLTNCEFERILSKRVSSKRVLYNALTIEGKVQQWKGEWEAAIQLFQQARKYSHGTLVNKTQSAVSIGLCHAYLGNYEKAMESLTQLDEAGLQDYSTVHELARAYALTGDLERAIACFEKARGLLAENASRGYLDEILNALYEIREADAAGPISLQTCILLYDAMRDYETNNIQAGIKKLQRALELNPMDSKIHHQLGIGLLRQGQYEKAVQMLERCLEFDPLHEQAQFALGDAYFHLELYECAFNAYKQTLHINPHNIDAYHHLGLVYEQQGDIETAKGYWEDVLKVKPTHQEALQSLQRYAQHTQN